MNTLTTLMTGGTLAGGLVLGLSVGAASAQSKEDLKDLKQDRREIRQDTREIRQDRREIRQDRRKLHRDRKAGVREDLKDRRQNVRDLRHDRRDLRREMRQTRSCVPEGSVSRPGTGSPPLPVLAIRDPGVGW
jgi:chromosome segregation ATPase